MNIFINTDNTNLICLLGAKLATEWCKKIYIESKLDNNTFSLKEFKVLITDKKEQVEAQSKNQKTYDLIIIVL